MHTQSQDYIIVLNKPKNICSNRAIQKVKSHFKLKKVGHSGTLDNFAEGILLVLTGKATKISSLFIEANKSYRAELEFGIETDTLDSHGNVIAKKNLPLLRDLEGLNTKFIGEMWQMPPKYSAIHIQGQRASTLARKGARFEMPKRKIKILDFYTELITLPYMTFSCTVTKGTYIRALARDIAYHVNSCAYLHSLKRTRQGDFVIEDSIQLENLLSLHSCNENTGGIISLHEYIRTHAMVLEIRTEDLSVRKSLEFGIQPIHLLHTKTRDSQHKFIYIVDSLGALGLWKYDGINFKLIYHY